MDDTVNYLNAHKVSLLKEGELRDSSNSTLGATVGMLWLDIEGTQVSYFVYLFFIIYTYIIHNYSTGLVLPPTMLTSLKVWSMKERSVEFLLEFIPLLLNGTQSWEDHLNSLLFPYGMPITIIQLLSLISRLSVDGPSLLSSNMLEPPQSVLLLLIRITINIFSQVLHFLFLRHILSHQYVTQIFSLS